MDVFQALADPVRRDLLTQLVDGPARVVDLTSGQQISRPAVSRHLRVLSEAGLVRTEDRGRERHYSLDRRPLAEVHELLGSLEGRGGRGPLAAGSLDALEAEVRRAVRDRRTGSRSASAPSTAREDIA